ncbi:histone H1 [Listeria monocytogenes FSL F2-208]|nr:histone H1 [Listeria monocytogenes FSL F2-208]
MTRTLTPALFPAKRPFRESSTIRASVALTSSALKASKNKSGSGLIRVTSSAVIIASKYSSKPSRSK